MRFTTFKNGNGDAVKVRADAVVAATLESPRRCRLLFGAGSGVTVCGTVEEASAALEAACAPAVAPVVEVAATDLERAAKVLDRLANAACDGGWVYLDDNAIGISSYNLDWADTPNELYAIAARLRGTR